MVARAAQRGGLGRQRTRARFHQARSRRGIRRLRLDASQPSLGFYARFGFELEGVTRDADAPGLDRWDMVLRF